MYDYVSCMYMYTVRIQYIDYTVVYVHTYLVHRQQYSVAPPLNVNPSLPPPSPLPHPNQPTRGEAIRRTWKHALPPIQPPRPPILRAVRPFHNLDPVPRLEVQIALRLRLKVVQRHDILRRRLRLRLERRRRGRGLLRERRRCAADVRPGCGGRVRRGCPRSPKGGGWWKGGFLES